MATVTNVFRRGSSYYFRTRVPRHLVPRVQRRELWRSLHTPSATEARRRAIIVAGQTQTLWADLGRPTMTTLAIKQRIDAWLVQQLDRDADARVDGDANWATEFDRAHSGFPSVSSLLGELTSFEASASQVESARQHAAETLRELGLDPDGPQLRSATQMMLRAQAELFHASSERSSQSWDPWSEHDPASRQLDRLASRLPVSSAASPAASREGSMTAHRVEGARLDRPFRVAAQQAIRELARMDKFKPKRIEDYESAMRTFLEWSGGELEFTGVTAEMAGRYKLDLTYFPSNAHKRLPYRDLGTFDAILTASKERGEPNLLSPTTINTKYLTPLRRIYEWQRSAGLPMANPFQGIQLPKTRRKDAKGRRRDFSSTEVRRLFALPLFTGAAGRTGAALFKPGPVRVSDWRYWLPLVCLFSGMRLNEACGLALSDVREQDGELLPCSGRVGRTEPQV